MKKNILTVVIMAASLINMILTAVLVFSVMPAMNKTSSLVDKVASVISLEVDSGNVSEQEYTMQDVESYDIDYENKATINLQKSEGDNSDHYAIISGVTISFLKTADDYSEISEMIKGQPVYVNDIVQEAISQHSKESITKPLVRDEAVKKLQEKYSTKCIVDISLKDFMTS